MIYFQSRKYNSEIDCSFFVEDGSKPAMLDGVCVGDSVCLMLDISEETHNAINDNVSPGSNLRACSLGFGGDGNWFVNVMFRVIERKHTFSWKKIGTLRTFGTSTILQAENGWHEDVFLWLCCGERPAWVRGSE